MSKLTERNFGGALAPVVHRRWRIPPSLGWIALVTVLGMKFVVCRSADLDCETAVSGSNDAIAVMVCEREYLNTGDPKAGALLAEAQLRSGNHAVASAIANGLVVTSARGIALRVLGKIATAEERFEIAEADLRRAQIIHRAEHDAHDLARDDVALIATQGYLYHYAEALRTAADCLSDAAAAHEILMEFYCHTAAISA